MLTTSTYGALYVSRDGGLSWTYVYSVTAFSPPVYSPDFASDGIAFVSGFGLWKTTDGGTSWTQIMTQSVGQVTLSPQFGDDHTLFVSAGDLLISHDGGRAGSASPLRLARVWARRPSLPPLPRPHTFRRRR